MVTLEYKCVQPPFNPDEPVDWAEVRDFAAYYVHVSQNGYCYKCGPFPDQKSAQRECDSLIRAA